ncbi:hypothetical protein FOB58_002115 [Candida parapsilosis]|uniref:Uncharacterized protein n=2 Tax=Candida parapsilosis TaxID=5480 RepID=G8BAT5_CANPC|nr:uncharacterized protein CPAR2_807080 [Candida parapsilosis]KAF6052055.1 hypothetical protein FOB58_002115 [Candida parapsilosis]KAF6052448.1 hypothetical protein FOB60_002704 [Candida parapsilosis]KAF6053857.1 hypothetical protein FOB59_002139 [Candida parapsilosis]KAF6064224.1 hypothetical protein FOB61_002650 [Candida parapsilosis]KAI5902298.1 hypothetical protein K4G60_g1438 [Candida parapsilosis]
MQLIQLSLAGLMAISGAQSLFIPKNQDEFELITTKTDVKSLFKKYPNGKVLDDINDPNEKIFVYDVETVMSKLVK